jgi:hypothetical protein
VNFFDDQVGDFSSKKGDFRICNKQRRIEILTSKKREISLICENTPYFTKNL